MLGLLRQHVIANGITPHLAQPDVRANRALQPTGPPQSKAPGTDQTARQLHKTARRGDGRQGRAAIKSSPDAAQEEAFRRLKDECQGLKLVQKFPIDRFLPHKIHFLEFQCEERNQAGILVPGIRVPEDEDC